MRFRPAAMRVSWRVLGVVLVCAGSVLAGGAPAVGASCAPNPPVSPHAFTGTVISTERGGRVARVWTDDGRLVTVVGTPAGTGVTSVDRTYVVGVRYEFHPLDATDPFQDNICTRTRPVGPGTVPCGLPPGRPVAQGRPADQP